MSIFLLTYRNSNTGFSLSVFENGFSFFELEGLGVADVSEGTSDLEQFSWEKTDTVLELEPKTDCLEARHDETGKLNLGECCPWAAFVQNSLRVTHSRNKWPPLRLFISDKWTNKLDWFNNKFQDSSNNLDKFQKVQSLFTFDICVNSKSLKHRCQNFSTMLPLYLFWNGSHAISLY